MMSRNYCIQDVSLLFSFSYIFFTAMREREIYAFNEAFLIETQISMHS